MNDLILRKVIRVYADTSVFGGVYDEEFMGGEVGNSLVKLRKKGLFW